MTIILVKAGAIWTDIAHAVNFILHPSNRDSVVLSNDRIAVFVLKGRYNMATYRIHKTRDYTVMSNIHLRDKNLSLKAKGLLSVMLSLPDEWDYSINGLVMICKENKTAIETALKELKTNRYLVVTKKYPTETSSGRIEYEYDIFETPHEKLTVENQEVEKQGVENLSIENPPQLNTNKIITEKENNNKSSNYKYIVDFLNEKAGTNYRSTGADTKKHINARLNEGFTIDDFKTVIEKKCAEWRGTNMEQYLRPSTLFGTKFEQYLNGKAGTAKPSQASTEKINGKEYYKRDGKYYLVGGSNVAVDPFAEDDITAF